MSLRYLLTGGALLALLGLAGCGGNEAGNSGGPGIAPTTGVPAGSPPLATKKPADDPLTGLDDDDPLAGLDDDPLGDLPPEDRDSPLAKAQQLARQGDTEGARKVLEEAIAKDPKGARREILSLGMITQERAYQVYRTQGNDACVPVFFEAGKYAHMLADNHRDDLTPPERAFVTGAIYNEACAYAMKGEKEKGLDSLDLAVDLGYRNRSEIVNDETLANIKDSPRYKEILDRLGPDAPEPAPGEGSRP